MPLWLIVILLSILAVVVIPSNGMSLLFMFSLLSLIHDHSSFFFFFRKLQRKQWRGTRDQHVVLAVVFLNFPSNGLSPIFSLYISLQINQINSCVFNLISYCTMKVEFGIKLIRTTVDQQLGKMHVNNALVARCTEIK